MVMGKLKVETFLHNKWTIRMWAAGEVKVNIDKGTADPRHLSLSFNCIEPLQKDVLHHQLVVCFQLHNPEQIQITVMT